MPETVVQDIICGFKLYNGSIMLKRMWINQPSTLQQHHALHGLNVLAECQEGQYTTIWFLSGDVYSMDISKMCLSDHWK